MVVLAQSDLHAAASASQGVAHPTCRQQPTGPGCVCRRERQERCCETLHTSFPRRPPALYFQSSPVPSRCAQLARMENFLFVPAQDAGVTRTLLGACVSRLLSLHLILEPVDRSANHSARLARGVGDLAMQDAKIFRFPDARALPLARRRSPHPHRRPSPPCASTFPPPHPGPPPLCPVHACFPAVVIAPPPLSPHLHSRCRASTCCQPSRSSPALHPPPSPRWRLLAPRYACVCGARAPPRPGR